MRNIAVIDESFDSSLSEVCHLSIRYSDRYFTSAILDIPRMKYLAYKNFWFDEPTPRANLADLIRSIFNSDSYLTLPYRSVSFQYDTATSVLVPAPLFRKENPEAYFRFASPVRADDRIFFRKIPMLDSYVLFPVPVDVAGLVEIMLNNPQIYHQSCPQILEALTEAGSRESSGEVCAWIYPGFAYLAVVRSEQLLLHNSFTIRSTDDLLFFILYLYEQFSLSQEDTPLVIAGYPGLYPGINEMAANYIKRVVTRTFPSGYTYSPTFSTLEGHQLSTLINLARCE